MTQLLHLVTQYQDNNASYSKLPNFEKYDSYFPDKQILAAAVISSAVSFSSEKPYSHLFSLITLALISSKAVLKAGKLYKKMIYNKTGFSLEERTWGEEIKPPTGLSYTIHRKYLEESIISALNFSKQVDSSEHFIEFASQLIKQEGLWFSESIIRDLKQWSEEGFIPAGQTTPLTPAQLLTAKPFQRCCYSATYISEAFFYLPYIYRAMFNLEFKNEEETKKWKQFFFTDGNKLNDLRNKYNEKMQKIIKHAGGEEAVDKGDSDYVAWATPHTSLEQNFPKEPGDWKPKIAEDIDNLLEASEEQ